MNDESQEFEWNELKEIWVNSSQTREIHIRLSEFIEEIKVKTSDFEKGSIKKDLAILSQSWSQFERKISPVEKGRIKKDLKHITKFLKRFLNLFNKNE